MAMTLTIIDAVVARLRAAFPDLAVEYFPDKPSEYRLNHPKGALLVSYISAKYDEPIDTSAIVQPCTLKYAITVSLRQLNGKDGAVAVLTRLRAALVGYKPPNCRRKSWATGEQFLGESAGIWQYALDMATEAIVVEDEDIDNGPLLTHVTTVDGFNRGETRKQPDGSIIHEEYPHEISL